MPNYQLSKLYLILNDDFELPYVGSTAQKHLCQRLSGHRTKQRQNIYCKSHDIMNGNERIVLLYNFPCNSKEELIREERKVIESMECINLNIPGRTLSEWYQDNKDIHRKNTKEFYNKNKKEISEKRGVKITCECGAVVSKRNISSHKKTNKHTNNLKK